MTITATLNDDGQQTYTLITPNIVTTATGQQVDIGRKEVVTTAQLDKQLAAAQAQVDAINAKLAAIAAIAESV